jgi:hypothetical protein
MISPIAPSYGANGINLRNIFIIFIEFREIISNPNIYMMKNRDGTMVFENNL